MSHIKLPLLYRIAPDVIGQEPATEPHMIFDSARFFWKLWHSDSVGSCALYNGNETMTLHGPMSLREKFRTNTIFFTSNFTQISNHDQICIPLCDPWHQPISFGKHICDV